MSSNKVLILIVLFLSFSTVSAKCPEVIEGKFPGWSPRNTTGNLTINTPIKVEDFEVTVTKIIAPGIVRVSVLKHSSEYLKTSLQVGEDNIIKREDILLELHNTGGNVANLTIYTPHRANLTLASDVITETERNYTYPNEIFTLKVTLNNTGELEAKNIVLTPEFGDFQILDTNARAYDLCPGSTIKVEYKLKTPDVGKPFIYNLFLKLDYYDENIQLGRVQDHSEFYAIPIEIKSAVLEVERKTTNSSLDGPGRRVGVTITINNTGNLDAYNARWEDVLPPQIKVVQGINKWSGNILEGQRKIFTYYVTSETPIMCSGISKVAYQDRFGNSYESFSENSTIRFSPLLVIEKEINGIKWSISPIKSTVNGETTWKINEDKWWKKREYDTIIDSPKEVWINRTANVSVKIKNIGNTVARGVEVKEILKGLKAHGKTSWVGEISPGEERLLYNYTAEVIRHGNLTLRTDIGYIDVAPASLEFGKEYDSKCACYCTEKIEGVNFSSRGIFYGLYPGLNITQPSELKVLSDCEVDFNITLSSNGSDSVHDITARVAIPFRIIKGQTYHYIDVLKAQYYPDGSSRNWSPTNVIYEYTIRTPKVEKKSVFEINTTAEYFDLFGRKFITNSSTKLVVSPPLPPILFVAIEKKDLQITLNYSNETEVEEYGEGIIRLKNKGFAFLENISLKIELPRNVELASNDTAWQGREEATMRYANSTWKVYTGIIEWNGSLNVKEEEEIYFLLRGLRSGLYEIPYKVTFNGNELKGTLIFKVKGAILTITKEVSNTSIYEGDEVNVTLKSKNIGEATAFEVILSDFTPVNFVLIEGSTEIKVAKLKPGEEVINKYRIKGLYEGSYPLDPATVKWKDRVGNEYIKVSNELRINVNKKVIEKPEEVPKELKLTKKQAAVTMISSIIIILVILKTLTITKPVSKE
jgi:uncharacterized repeat protein (TIGR01451 family)